jgi:pyroglutamyl-peptidase
MRALVTGFDAFGGDVANPSYLAARCLPPRLATLQIVVAELPTSFARAPRRLRALIARVQPDIVLCVGLAADRAAISIERVALNLRHARIADNDGQQPLDKPVIASGPAAYFSTLPVMPIVRALARAGMPAEMSLSAGAFVCNHVFYHLMHAAAQSGRGLRAGFVHVPALPRVDTEGALAQLAHALQIVLRVTQRARA